MARLYVDGIDELLAKDAAFFHENFAGALTKRVLGFATQFENFVDVLAFRIVASAAAAGVRVGRAVAVRPAAGRSSCSG